MFDYRTCVGSATGEICNGSAAFRCCSTGALWSEAPWRERAALAATPVFAPAVRAARTLRLGYVSPQTGPLAAFAEADNFVIVNFLNTVRDGLRIGNETYPVEVSVKDSQSNPNRAADVARELIVGSKVDLMLVASTPETTNPVATMCEVEETPCISSVAPWQPYFIGVSRTVDPGVLEASSTFHFFWGLRT